MPYLVGLGFSLLRSTRLAPGSVSHFSWSVCVDFIYYFHGALRLCREYFAFVVQSCAYLLDVTCLIVHLCRFLMCTITILILWLCEFDPFLP